MHELFTPTSFIIPERLSMDLVRCVAYPYKAKKATELTGNIKNITIRDDIARSSIEVDITFYNFTRFAQGTLAPGTWIALNFFNPNTKRWDFPLKLYVWERGVTDRISHDASITAYDLMSFLHRSGQEDWLFKKDKLHPKGWTASEIANFIFKRMRVNATVPNLKSGHIAYLKMKAHTPYEAIVKAYTRHRVLTNQRFQIRAINDKIVISRLNVRSERTVQIGEGLNLTKVDWTESLDTKVTQVVARSIDSEGNVKRKVVVTSPEHRRYGIIRRVVDTEKDLGPSALKKLANDEIKLRGKIARNATIEGEGILGVRSGNVLLVDDRSGTGLFGRFYADSVTHMIEPGNHLMTVDLSWVARVPAIEVDPAELDPSAEQLPPGSEAIFPDPYSGRPFMNPLGRASYKIIGTFRVGTHTLGNWQSDAAIDMQAPPGTPVYACFSGTIIKVNRAGDGLHSGKIFGSQVTIQNPEASLSAFYTHITEVPKSLTAGSSIAIGQQIGVITEWAGTSSDHVHFALYNGPANGNNTSKYVDPEPLVAQAVTSTTTPGSTVDAPGTAGTAITGTGAYRTFARKLAVAYKIDPNFFEKQLHQESGFRPEATSSAGAEGIAQIVPRHHPIAAGFTRDPWRSMNYAAWLMASYLVQYNRRWDYALAAYNAGTGGASKYTRGGSFSVLPGETQEYVRIITGSTSPTTQSYGPAPNVGGPNKFPPGVFPQRGQNPLV